MSREWGNTVRAARALGVSRRSLYRLSERFEIASIARETLVVRVNKR